MNGAVSTLVAIGQVALSTVSGGLTDRHVYIVAYLDGFGVGSSTLTNEHRETMDRWIAGDRSRGFPLVPGAPTHRIVLVAGLASQTGPEQRNVELGEQRAKAVYDYLRAGLGASQVDDNVQTVGSSRPRDGFDDPGEEHPENRAVGVILEVRLPVVTSVPTPPPQDPPPPASRDWEINVDAVGTVGDPLPIVDLFGGQLITGELRNVRTDETRRYVIVCGGISAGWSALPADIGFNAQMHQVTPFTTRWVDFEIFDNSMVTIIGVGAADVVEWSSGSIVFHGIPAHVEPSTLMIKSNISGGAQLQSGIFMVLDP